jgi:zinc/manganese transport system substrate-binding protein
MYKEIRMILPIVVLATLPVVASAELTIFACEPEWAALASEIGGDTVEVYSATTALQDPHYIQARPSLIAKVRQADLVICSGAQLEIGWLPALLQKANNRDVMPGSDGYMEASSFVVRLDQTGAVDRAQGDIHPQGNPHVHLNPHNISRIADRLAERLGVLDPANSGNYVAALQDFRDRWDTATTAWEERGDSLRSLRLVSHHTSFSYLADWLDLDIVATLEPKPGVPPSAAHLASLLQQLSSNPPAAVIRAPYANEKPSDWLTERLHVKSLLLPYTVDGTGGPADLFALFDMTLAALEGVNHERL